MAGRPKVVVKEKLLRSALRTAEKSGVGFVGVAHLFEQTSRNYNQNAGVEVISGPLAQKNAVEMGIDVKWKKK